MLLELLLLRAAAVVCMPLLLLCVAAAVFVLLWLRCELLRSSFGVLRFFMLLHSSGRYMLEDVADVFCATTRCPQPSHAGQRPHAEPNQLG